MKKNYFLIINLFSLLITNLIINMIIVNNNFFYDTTTVNEINNIPSDKYLQLSYQNGKFYSWDQSENIDQHIIGVFTNNEQSYLLDNFGVYWNLDYQILNFERINNKIGIAQIEYFLNEENKKEYFSQNFFVELKNNKLIITDNIPILSKNPNFTVLNEEYIIASGIGLELIKINEPNIEPKILIPPYEKGSFFTSFYRINDTDGIFSASDQYFYLLRNITGVLSQTKINLKVSTRNNSNIVKINENKIVLRDKDSKLYFLDISKDISIKDWKKISYAKNIAFVLDENSFILNTSLDNSSIEYGNPYLIKINNWNTLIKIPNIKSINNFMFINGTKGIFIDKYLQANIFSYQSDDSSFVLSKYGTLNSFQFINKNLFFGSLKNNNLLISMETNQQWEFTKNVHFSVKNPQGKYNLLNNVIFNGNENIDYQNTYFSNGPTTISVNSEKLMNVIVISDTNTKTLWKNKNNNITYDFLDFDFYKVIVNFISNNIEYSLNYQVRVVDLSMQDLVNISGSKLVSYVGYVKTDSQEQLIDIKSINQKDSFIINQFNYNYLQYIELYIYGDSKNMVVKNVYNLISESKIKANFKPEDERLFFGLKIVNLLNQISWIYLGFNNGSEKPVIDFWDTDFGKKLMNQAFMRRYTGKELRNMNSQQIMQLIRISNNWQAIAIQGKAIVICVVSFFVIAFIGVFLSLGYNIWLNKKIKIEEVEKNKIFKNPLDF